MVTLSPLYTPRANPYRRHRLMPSLNSCLMVADSAVVASCTLILNISVGDVMRHEMVPATEPANAKSVYVASGL